MAHINVLTDGVDLDDPFLVEGFPGAGLVGKIAADHLVEAFEMTRYATVHCAELPQVVTYGEDDSSLTTPVRLYADVARDLVVLQSDVPVSSAAAAAFAGCLTEWFTAENVTPIYLSGLPREKDSDPPAMYGLAAGDGGELLERAEIDAPAETGLVSGPTGALLSHAVEQGATAVGLVVESDPQFPDPEASRTLLSDGIEPLVGHDVPTEALVDRVTEIQRAKEQLARQIQDAGDESTKAHPLRMYQ